MLNPSSTYVEFGMPTCHTTLERSLPRSFSHTGVKLSMLNFDFFWTRHLCGEELDLGAKGEGMAGIDDHEVARASWCMLAMKEFLPVEGVVEMRWIVEIFFASE